MGRITSVLLALTLAAVCITTAALAQTTAKNIDTVNVELKDVDVRSAIEALFRGTGRNLSIDASVSGTVPTVSFKDVPFDTALKQLVKSAGLVYRVDQDVYIISKKPEINPNGLTASSDMSSYGVASYVDQPTEKETIIEKIPLSHQSASEILAMLGSVGHDYSGGAAFGQYGQLGNFGSPSNWGGNTFGNTYGNTYPNTYGTGYNNYRNNYGTYGTSGYLGRLNNYNSNYNNSGYNGYGYGGYRGW